ncbi:POU domain: class 6: transcription factor 1-like protein [Dinothrombium tinctorium]|uniref:POU domain protein n=1 Tax=Dinothrombium tinctorium TaxID=1965070 RepID=A0A3S3QTV2_9ACAR|nr:POU domain: class 6: transcription factor 1-like protein [Dinothrombium tinctorium]
MTEIDGKAMQQQLIQQQPMKYAIQTSGGQSFVATPTQISQLQEYIQQQFSSTQTAALMSGTQQPSQSQIFTSSIIPAAGTQYLLTSNGQATGTLLQGYQTSSGTQILIPSATGNSAPQLLNSQAVVPTAAAALNTQLNQLVQVVLGNGQTITTTLANLQAMGINTAAANVSQQQYATYHFANANAYQPPSMQTQLVTNSIGQVFAVTPQVIPGAAQTIIATTPQGNAHFIQIAAPSTLPLVSALTNAQVQSQTVQQSVAPTNLQQGQQVDNEATRLHEAITENEKDCEGSCQQINQETQVSLSTCNVSTTPQPTVSSTTSHKPNSASVSLSPKNSTPSQSADFNPERVSVQSQTSSPASSSSNGSGMEPESTTQNVNTLAITISNTDASIVDGVNLEEIKEFARQFKLRRISLGLTQTQVGQALSATEGPSYSQSAICRFEKLDITPKSAQKIKPVLEKWMEEAEERYKTGNHTLTDFIGTESNKKRKRRTSFTPAALDVLNNFFEKNTHPSGSEMTELAERLNYDREVVRVWFCNKRQALRNTIKRLEPTTVVHGQCDSF